MEMHTIIRNIIDHENDRETDKESANELKIKLRKQIEQLKSIILQTECNLGISKFANTQYIVESQTSNDMSSNEIPNINTQLESALYKYSGFYCVKFTRQECVFNFSSLNKHDRKHTYAIQMFTDKEKVKLGKWLMPMPIDLHDLMSELSINDLKDVPYFLKTCKHYIDCYFIRQKQFVALMDVVSRIKNCNLQTNLEYTQINLELMGVYNEINDEYVHIIVYLLYKINEIKPDKIKVDSKTEGPLNPQSIKHLKASLACFKQLDLQVAFEEMLNKGPFIWSKEEDEDSPLEMNNSNSSDSDGFLEGYLLSKEKSIELPRRRRKVKKKQRTIKRQKISDLSNLSGTSKDISYVSSLQEEEEEEEKEQEPENKEQHTKNTSNNDVAKPTPTVNKPNQKKLRQRKLEFRKEKLNQSTKNDAVSSEVTSLKKAVYRKQNQPFTSTPIHRKKQDSNLISSTNTDISDITVNGK